jgi:hypothetical protein
MLLFHQVAIQNCHSQLVDKLLNRW